MQYGVIHGSRHAVPYTPGLIYFMSGSLYKRAHRHDDSEIIIFLTSKIILGAPWVAQSVRRPTLDFGSCRDLTVCGF